MDPRSPSPSHRLPDLRRPPTRGGPARLAAWAAALALALLLGLSPAAAQGGCSEDGRNMQCTGFGRISMDSQRDVRGDPIDVSAAITLDTGYADQGARWLLFSVRNVEADGSNPVTIELDHFTSPYGDIVTTRVEHATANELDLWVDILDTPVGAPIDLALHVGATERGAFRLETLVMAFDRGYAPIKDSDGNDASLFSFTLLGVNKETGAVNPDGGSLADGKKLPALGAVPLLSAVALLAVLARRRLA